MGEPAKDATKSTKDGDAKDPQASADWPAQAAGAIEQAVNKLTQRPVLISKTAVERKAETEAAN